MARPKMPSRFICSMSFSGYSLACSSSRATGRTSRSTKSATVSTMACSSSVRSAMLLSFLGSASEDALGAEGGDAGVGAAKLPEDGLGVLAESRHRVHQRVNVSEVGRGQQGAAVPARRADGTPPVSCGQHGMVEKLGHRVEPGVRHCCPVKHGLCLA